RRHPSAKMFVAVAAQRAALFHDLIRGAEPPPGSFEPEVLQQARRIVRDCAVSSGAVGSRAFLFTVALNVVPYLPPAELKTVGTPRERLRCLYTPSRGERDWIALRKTVGKRDGRDRAERAEGLLQAQDEPTERRHYLLAVAMLGRVAASEPSAAHRLWEAQ